GGYRRGFAPYRTARGAPAVPSLWRLQRLGSRKALKRNRKSAEAGDRHRHSTGNLAAILPGAARHHARQPRVGPPQAEYCPPIPPELLCDRAHGETAKDQFGRFGSARLRSSRRILPHSALGDGLRGNDNGFWIAPARGPFLGRGNSRRLPGARSLRYRTHTRLTQEKQRENAAHLERRSRHATGVGASGQKRRS